MFVCVGFLRWLYVLVFCAVCLCWSSVGCLVGVVGLVGRLVGALCLLPIPTSLPARWASAAGTPEKLFPSASLPLRDPAEEWPKSIEVNERLKGIGFNDMCVCWFSVLVFCIDVSVLVASVGCLCWLHVLVVCVGCWSSELVFCVGVRLVGRLIELVLSVGWLVGWLMFCVFDLNVHRCPLGGPRQRGRSRIVPWMPPDDFEIQRRSCRKSSFIQEIASCDMCVLAFCVGCLCWPHVLAVCALGVGVSFMLRYSMSVGCVDFPCWLSVLHFGWLDGWSVGLITFGRLLARLVGFVWGRLDDSLGLVGWLMGWCIALAIYTTIFPRSAGLGCGSAQEVVPGCPLYHFEIRWRG